MKKPELDFVNESNMSLLTDFYELTMCASYFENNRNETATFDLFIRKLPPNRAYFIFAGLEQVLPFSRKHQIQRRPTQIPEKTEIQVKIPRIPKEPQVYWRRLVRPRGNDCFS